MSDLATNILRNQLREFTITQCQKLDVSLDGIRWGYCWEESAGAWVYCRWQRPIAYGKPILFNSKEFLSRNCHLGAESHIQQQLLAYLQREHLINRSPLCHQRILKGGRVKFTQPTRKSPGAPIL